MWQVEVGSPQFYGIVAGCVVYVVTVAAVLLLLFKSGSVARMIDEIKQGKPIGKSEATIMPLRATLFDELIAARGALPVKPNLPRLNGQFIALVPLVRRDQFAQLFQVSDGSAIFDYGKYDPMRIWGFFPEGPFADADAMMSADIFSVAPGNVQHFGILEKVTDKLIGSVSLRNNEPRHLSIEIDTLWLTPAFQGKSERRAREAVYLLLKELFDMKYRRIQVTVDVLNVIGRKFFERLGFQQDGVLRKHRIVRLANQDSIVYSLTNSCWFGQAAGGYSRPVRHHLEKQVYGKVLPTPKDDAEGSVAQQSQSQSKPAEQARKQAQPAAPKHKRQQSNGDSNPPPQSPASVPATSVATPKQPEPTREPVGVVEDDEQPLDLEAEESDDDADELAEYAFYQSGFIATQGFSNLLNNRQPRLAPAVNKSRSTTDLQGLHSASVLDASVSFTTRGRLSTAVNTPFAVNEVTDDDADDAGEWQDASAMNSRLRRRQLNSKEA